MNIKKRKKTGKRSEFFPQFFHVSWTNESKIYVNIYVNIFRFIYFFIQCFFEIYFQLHIFHIKSNERKFAYEQIQKIKK